MLIHVYLLKFRFRTNDLAPLIKLSLDFLQPKSKNEEEQLDELQFLGSECTKDCSGHRAGYEWSARKGNIQGNSPYSPSFNKGANLRAAGK